MAQRKRNTDRLTVASDIRLRDAFGFEVVIMRADETYRRPTERELQVVGYLIQGHTAQAVAGMYGKTRGSWATQTAQRAAKKVGAYGLADGIPRLVALGFLHLSNTAGK